MDIERAFDDRAASYPREEWHRTYAERLVTLTPIRPGDRVLDVATGTGFAAIAAGRRGATVIGADISEAMVREARRAGIDAIRADGQRLPFPDETFDVVLCSSALAYMDARVALAEWRRVSRPGGVVAFSTMRAGQPEASALFRQVASRLGVDLPDPNAPAGSPSAAARLLADVGLEMVELAAGDVDWPLPTPEAAWDANLASPLNAAVRRLDPLAIRDARTEFLRAAGAGRLGGADVLYVIARRPGPMP